MVANIRGYTPNYKFKLINFDTPRWHSLEYSNWQLVDNMLLQLGSTPIRGEWLNATLYLEGDRVFDPITNDLYRALVEHTSALTGTFEEDRIANPDNWVRQTGGVPLYRGTWLPGVSYAPGDIVKINSYVYYLCTTQHVSSPAFNTDVANWTLVFDASATIADANAAKDAAAASATASAASATNAATSATNAAASATAAANSVTAAQVEKIVWMGNWSNSTTYRARDAVAYNGSSYIAKVGNTNVVPVVGAEWDLLARQGDVGPIGPVGATGPKGDKGDKGDQGIPGTPGTSVAIATAAEYIANSAAGSAVSPKTAWDAAAYLPVSTDVAGTYTLNMSQQLNFYLALNGNKTVAAPTGTKDNQMGVIYIAQGGAGNFTITWNAAWKFPGGVKPTLSTAPGSLDMVTYVVSSSAFIMCSFQADFK